MRVRRTVPPFTFGFSKPFVNRICAFSTDFSGFYKFLCGFDPRKAIKALEIKISSL
jgi:hypothetical protein